MSNVLGNGWGAPSYTIGHSVLNGGLNIGGSDEIGYDDFLPDIDHEAGPDPRKRLIDGRTPVPVHVDMYGPGSLPTFPGRFRPLPMPSDCETHCKPTHCEPEPCDTKCDDEGDAHSSTVTVKSGDTLDSIAKCHGTTWQKLYDANRDVVCDANLIHPGQKLRIPNGDCETKCDTPAPAPAHCDTPPPAPKHCDAPAPPHCDTPAPPKHDCAPPPPKNDCPPPAPHDDCPPPAPHDDCPPPAPKNDCPPPPPPHDDCPPPAPKNDCPPPAPAPPPPPPAPAPAPQNETNIINSNNTVNSNNTNVNVDVGGMVQGIAGLAGSVLGSLNGGMNSHPVPVPVPVPVRVPVPVNVPVGVPVNVPVATPVLQGTTQLSGPPMKF